LVLALVLARSLAKILGVTAITAIYRRSLRKGMASGMLLIPMAGLAIGLALTASNMFPQHASMISAIVLGAVAVFETMGPPIATFAFGFAGETKEQVAAVTAEKNKAEKKMNKVEGKIDKVESNTDKKLIVDVPPKKEVQPEPNSEPVAEKNETLSEEVGKVATVATVAINETPSITSQDESSAPTDEKDDEEFDEDLDEETEKELTQKEAMKKAEKINQLFHEEHASEEEAEEALGENIDKEPEEQSPEEDNITQETAEKAQQLDSDESTVIKTIETHDENDKREKNTVTEGVTSASIVDVTSSSAAPATQETVVAKVEAPAVDSDNKAVHVVELDGAEAELQTAELAQMNDTKSSKKNLSGLFGQFKSLLAKKL
jgi:hypothetical protein